MDQTRELFEPSIIHRPGGVVARLATSRAPSGASPPTGVGKFPHAFLCG